MGAVFVLIFFLLRVVWLAHLSYVGWGLATRLERIIIFLFTLLNYYWFVMIVLKALRKNKASSSPKLNDRKLEKEE